jgi:hypothetical protein
MHGTYTTVAWLRYWTTTLSANRLHHRYRFAKPMTWPPMSSQILSPSWTLSEGTQHAVAIPGMYSLTSRSWINVSVILIPFDPLGLMSEHLGKHRRLCAPFWWLTILLSTFFQTYMSKAMLQPERSSAWSKFMVRPSSVQVPEDLKEWILASNGRNKIWRVNLWSDLQCRCRRRPAKEWILA